MCPDLSSFACKQSQRREREPLHATPWLKTRSFLHRQAHSPWQEKLLYLYRKTMRENLTLDSHHSCGEDCKTTKNLSSSAHLTSKLAVTFLDAIHSRFVQETTWSRYLVLIKPSFLSVSQTRSLPSHSTIIATPHLTEKKREFPEDGMHAYQAEEF